MKFNKVFYLILLSFYQTTHTSNNSCYIIIENKTNLPLIVKQVDREICLCPGRTSKTVKILNNITLDCFLRKHKHRMFNRPLKLIPSETTTKILFYKENNLIIGEIRDYDDASSEELEN